MKDVIKVQKLSKSYGGKTAVAEVSLTVSGEWSLDFLEQTEPERVPHLSVFSA